jgi:hypothetical protein
VHETFLPGPELQLVRVEIDPPFSAQRENRFSAERRRGQLCAKEFNTFNHADFALPSALSYNNSNLGDIASPRNSLR